MRCVRCGEKSGSNDLCDRCYMNFVGTQITAICEQAIATHRYEPAVIKIKELISGATSRSRTE